MKEGCSKTFLNALYWTTQLGFMHIWAADSVSVLCNILVYISTLHPKTIHSTFSLFSLIPECIAFPVYLKMWHTVPHNLRVAENCMYIREHHGTAIFRSLSRCSIRFKAGPLGQSPHSHSFVILAVVAVLLGRWTFTLVQGSERSGAGYQTRSLWTLLHSSFPQLWLVSFPQHDAAITVGMVLARWWAVPGFLEIWRLSFGTKISVFISSDQRIVSHALVIQMPYSQLQPGCHVPFTEDWLPSGRSTIQVWLAESCRNINAGALSEWKLRSSSKLLQTSIYG